MREIGEADKGARRDAEQFADDAVGAFGRLQRLRQDGIVERIVGIIGEVAVCVALHHRQPLRHRCLDRRGVDFEPARVDLLSGAQLGHQRAVAAADVERAHACRNCIGDDAQIGAKRTHQPAPSAPATIRSSAGTSSRKLS